MSRKKDSIALFEAIARSRQRRQQAGVDVPRWMDGTYQAQRPGAAQDDAGGAPAAPATARPTSPPPLARPAGAQAAPARAAHAARPAEPMLRTGEGRVRLSLNYVSCGVIGLSVVVLLIAAFALGRLTAGGSAAAPAEQASVGGGGGEPAENGVGQPDQPPLNPGVARRESGTSPGRQSPPATHRRIPSKYYLVVQDLLGRGAWERDEADRIVEFLAARAHKADVRTLHGHYVVWSAEPMDSDRSAAALELGREVERLGKMYRQQRTREGAAKTYDFRQRRDGRFEPWYIRYHPE